MGSVVPGILQDKHHKVGQWLKSAVKGLLYVLARSNNGTLLTHNFSWNLIRGGIDPPRLKTTIASPESMANREGYPLLLGNTNQPKEATAGASQTHRGTFTLPVSQCLIPNEISNRWIQAGAPLPRTLSSEMKKISEVKWFTFLHLVVSCLFPVTTVYDYPAPDGFSLGYDYDP